MQPDVTVVIGLVNGSTDLLRETSVHRTADDVCGVVFLPGPGRRPDLYGLASEEHRGQDKREVWSSCLQLDNRIKPAETR